MKVLWPFAGSIFLHFLIFIFVLEPNAKETSVEILEETEIIEFTTAPTNKTNNSTSNPTHQMRLKKISIRKLTRNQNFYNDVSSNIITKTNLTDSHKANYDQYSFRNSTAEENLQNHILLEQLWNHINAQIHYPKEFAEQRISGGVRVHFVLNQNGLSDKDPLIIESESIYLKTFIAAMISHILSSPLPRTITHQISSPLSINCLFDFHLYSHTDIPEEEYTPPISNTLFFKKEAYVTAKVVEEIQDFFIDKHIPPILPVPGGFYVDFVLALKVIRGIGSEKQETLRLQNTQDFMEKLKLLVRTQNKKANTKTF